MADPVWGLESFISIIYSRFSPQVLVIYCSPSPCHAGLPTYPFNYSKYKWARVDKVVSPFSWASSPSSYLALFSLPVPFFFHPYFRAFHLRVLPHRFLLFFLFVFLIFSLQQSVPPWFWCCSQILQEKLIRLFFLHGIECATTDHTFIIFLPLYPIPIAFSSY